MLSKIGKLHKCLLQSTSRAGSWNKFFHLVIKSWEVKDGSHLTMDVLRVKIIFTQQNMARYQVSNELLTLKESILNQFNESVNAYLGKHAGQHWVIIMLLAWLYDAILWLFVCLFVLQQQTLLWYLVKIRSPDILSGSSL